MADATTTDPKLAVWKCKTCGCLWRDNLDESVSLLDAEQKSCAICEKSPTNAACAIHWIPVKAALLSESQPSVHVDRADLLLGPVSKRLDRGQYRTLPPETIEGDITALVKAVTALHAERDRLKAEAARLRAALTEIARWNEGYWGDGVRIVPWSVKIARDALGEAALASSGTVGETV